MAAPTNVEAADAAGTPVVRTIGTKSLRTVPLTMEPCTSLDMQLSIRVHTGGRCDGVVDVGYGCQSGADPADYLGDNRRRQGLMESHALVRRLVV